MRHSTAVSLAFLVAALVSAPSATAQSQVAPGTIADNDSIFIDGTTFKITPGKAKNDSSSVIKTLGARELGPGAIVFRSGEKLYIVDAPLRLPEGNSANRQNVFVNADKRQTNRIRVEYVSPKNPEHQTIYEMLKAHAALETVQKLFSPFRLPTEVTIKNVGCDGMVNAWYEVQDSRPTVTVCYEYLHVIMQHAPKETTLGGTTRADAIVGQMLFLVAHEMGHAVFELLNIPIFGREEDAADQVAAHFMLQLGKERARGLIGGAAYAYMGYMKGYKENPKVAIPLEALSSNHGSPEERFYNLLCIAFGADPQLFADIVEQGYLPKTRAGSCRYEYRTLAKAIRGEIDPHVDRQMAGDIWESNWLPESTLRAGAN
jgi:hypothetical protein